MTIGTNKRNDYIGNDSKSTYDYTYKIFAESDLLVTVREPVTEIETELTLGVGYASVTNVGDKDGGSLTLQPGFSWIDTVTGYLITGWSLTIRRRVVIEQATDIKNQGRFQQQIHENAFDYLTMIDQQQEDNIERALKLPETLSSGVDPTVPVPTPLASLAWNAAGTALENKILLDTYTVTPYIETLLDDATAAAARATLGLDTSDNVQFTDGTFTGDLVVNGATLLTGKIRFTSIINPAQITGNQNNYTPTGIGSAYEVRVDSNGAYNITGINAAQSEGRELVITNDGTNILTLTHQDALSTAANRFDLPSDNDVEIPGGASVRLRYDGGVSRWRLVGGAGLGGGATGGSGDKVFYLNDQTVDSDYTIAADQNAMSAGKVTISNGVKVTVANGARWVIL